MDTGWHHVEVERRRRYQHMNATNAVHNYPNIYVAYLLITNLSDMQC